MSTPTGPDPQRDTSTFTSDVVWQDPTDPGLVIAIEWKIQGETLIAEAIGIRSNANEGVTARQVHRLPLGRIINSERARLLEEGTLLSGFQQSKPLSDGEVDDLASTGGPDQGRHLTDGDLRLVAHLYIKAYRDGDPVQRSVANRLGVSIPTAARRIGLAREKGFIDQRYTQTRGRARSLKV